MWKTLSKSEQHIWNLKASDMERAEIQSNTGSRVKKGKWDVERDRVSPYTYYLDIAPIEVLLLKCTDLVPILGGFLKMHRSCTYIRGIS